LSPRKQDYESGITPLEKFIYTLVQIERDLEDNFGFTRNSNGEIPYILFVDEADLISKHSSIDQYTKLTFLKECMEGIDKSEQSQNLWIFATNHISKIDEAVYQAGRLSNALNFS
jgi:SpoVK/Ycf46/Vps4 family AAA+-type ATPase